MSGVIKGIKKVFKKVVKVVKKVVKAVVKFIKKIAKPLLIAAAIYFTAGLAIGAFGGASVIASAPGWGATGIFTKAAVAIGAPGFGAAAPLFGAGAAAGASTLAPAAPGVVGGTTALEVGGTIGSVEGLTASTMASIPGSVASGLPGMAPITGAGSGIVNTAAAVVPGISTGTKLALAYGGGQMLSGAAQGYSNAKIEEERKKERDEIRARNDARNPNLAVSVPRTWEDGVAAPGVSMTPATGTSTDIARAAVAGAQPQTTQTMSPSELLAQKQGGIVQNPQRTA